MLAMEQANANLSPAYPPTTHMVRLVVHEAGSAVLHNAAVVALNQLQQPWILDLGIKLPSIHSHGQGKDELELAETPHNKQTARTMTRAVSMSGRHSRGMG